MINDVEHLETLLSEPSPLVVETLSRLDGDLIFLGVGGKMGPTLARMAKRADELSGKRRRILGVSRFSNPSEREKLEKWGIETITCDLLDPDQLACLPEVPNVVFMTGMKFGSTDNQPRTWAMNVYLPGMVAQHYRRSRLVAFSTGNVYGLSPVKLGGSLEDDPLHPSGEYSLSAVGRERILQYFSAIHQIPMAILRLNYATEMRYGVLVDISNTVLRGEAINLTMGHLNALWQGDANAMSLCAFAQVATPPFVVNLAGPEVLSVRRIAEAFGHYLGKPPRFEGKEADDALLSNGQLGHRLFGYPRVGPHQMMAWIADWVRRGGESLDKPTHFEVRDGNFYAPQLQRHFGLLQATALNISMIVGAGVFITIPLMLGKLPGPYALLGWLVAGALMIVDGMIWSELGATLPSSGGTYQYLLESYGRDTWGRLMAFLFVWQFLISGPLEVASGLIAIATFSDGFGSGFADFNKAWTWQWPADAPVLTVNPARLGAFAIGLFIVLLLYRRVSTLGRLTVTIWLGVLLAIGFVLVDGALHFDPAIAFDFSGRAAEMPVDFASGLGGAMTLAMYSYLGYYTICYVGDEVRDPGKTIPRSILLSAVLVCVLFTAVHLAMVGVVPWQTILEDQKNDPNYSLPAAFMKALHGEGFATVLITLLLIWSCFGSAFAGLLGYSRIPYGAARQGHFFAAVGKVHPHHRIPHVSLLLVGALTLFWSFFNLQDVIDAMIVTRVLEQFLGQVFAVMLLRKRPGLPHPYRMWLYPLPCLLALAGWLFIYYTSELRFIVLGLATLLAGTGVFVLWSWRTRRWPFGTN